VLLLLLQLVIASACDHYTRTIHGGTHFSPTSLVVGLLFGTVDIVSGVVQVMDGTDVMTTSTTATATITGYQHDDMQSFDITEVTKKVQLWTKVYPHYELVGCYAFGKTLTEQHRHFQQSLSASLTSTASTASIALHKQQQPRLLLLFDSDINTLDVDHIPIRAYSTSPPELHHEKQQQQLHHHQQAQSQQLHFEERSWKTASSEVETIAVNHITRSMPRAAGHNPLQRQNDALLTSTRILHAKLDMVLEALRAMQSGQRAMDHTLLRTAATIVQGLDSIATNASLAREMDESIDAARLVLFLAGIDKNHQELKAVKEVMSLVVDKPTVSL
jgi:hypothetical protein